MRIVFVNLHGNEFLLKTSSKMLFKQAVAIKHKYFLDYLLEQPDVEVCSYINKKGFSLAYTLGKPFAFLRFLEHKIVLKKNGIDLSKIKVLKRESEIRNDDIIIMYQYYANQFAWTNRPNVFIAVSMIHFGTAMSSVMKELQPNVLFNESNLKKYSKIFNHFYGWFDKDFLIQPFVYAPRFKSIRPFQERENRAVSVGTITYMDNITCIYGDPCAQPARKQIKEHAKELEDYIACFNNDYKEDNIEKKVLPNDSFLIRLYKQWYNKTHVGQQKSYYSFNMVDKFNDFKMCVVGEEIMGIPGVGFVEGMACGCAYIGQTLGYYEDLGMQEGVHYIGYDGSLDDLKRKIHYYQQTEHQDELERIARTGYEYVRTHFNSQNVAECLLNKLKSYIAK